MELTIEVNYSNNRKSSNFHTFYLNINLLEPLMNLNTLIWKLLLLQFRWVKVRFLQTFDSKLLHYIYANNFILGQTSRGSY